MRRGYYGFGQYQTTIEKVDDQTIPARIDALIVNPNSTDREKEFCNSIKAGWAKYKSLTKNQYSYFEAIEKRYNPEMIKANDEWKNNFTEDMRKRLKICAEYYINAGYFTDIAKKAIENSDWIPTEKQFRAMCENKYAQRLIENMNTPPKFQPGSLVIVKGYKTPCMVFEVGDTCTPTRGSRHYKVLPLGDDRTVEFQERYLKKHKGNK